MRRESPVIVQFRVLFALLMREMTTRYGRNVGGYVWAVLEPVGTVVMLTLVFSAIARRPALGDSFPVFFATGYMAFHFYSDISRAVSTAVSSNKALLTFPRVTIFDTILARFILHLLTTIFVSVVVIVGALQIFPEPIHLDLYYILLSVFLSASLAFSVGLMNSSLFIWSPTWQTTFNIVNRPLFLISGGFFLYEDLPVNLQEYAWWNPLLHITALMRAGIYPNYGATFASPLFVALFTCGILFFGVLMLRTLRAEILES